VREVAEEFGHRFNVRPIFTGHETGSALLSNASKAHSLLGAPQVKPAQVIDWIAHWITNGGVLLGKPTHFEVHDGKF
jgi:hypothetical protein